MKDIAILIGVALGVLVFAMFLVFGLPWLGVIANRNLCRAYTFGGEAWHAEAAWYCHGISPRSPEEARR